MLFIELLCKLYWYYEVVKNVSFYVNENECVVLLGFNGVGKIIIL